MKGIIKKISIIDGSAYISGVLIVIIWLLVTMATLGRYFFGVPLAWVVQLSEYTLLFITYFSASWILKQEGHVRVEIFISKLSKTERHLFDILSIIVIIFVSIVLLIYGLIICQDYYLSGVITEGIIKFPRFIIILFIPLSGLLLLIQSLRMLFKKK